MNTLKCQVKGHSEKLINTVCLDMNCKENRFCCLMCLVNNHNTHQSKSIEISEITQFIEYETNKQVTYPETSSYGQKQIIQGLEQLITLIDNIQKIIKEEINIIKQQNLKDFLQQTRDSYQDMEYWKHLLEGILQYVDIENNHLNQKAQNETLNNLEQQQMKIVQNSDQSLQKILEQIHLSKKQGIKSQFYFKEERKNQDIEIIDQNTIQKIQNETYSMAFANEGFDPVNQNYSFAFNIPFKVKYVWIGVGNDEGDNLPSYLISEDKFKTVGHGLYMISSDNAHSYHHTDKKVNFKTKGMNYGERDKIYIKYDYVTKGLEFRKASDQNAVVKMKITNLTQRLYPCAMLYYAGDLVQLVDN